MFDGTSFLGGLILLRRKTPLTRRLLVYFLSGAYRRHTAKRIWDRLKAEHGFSGGYTVVKDYVRQARLQRDSALARVASLATMRALG